MTRSSKKITLECHGLRVSPTSLNVIQDLYHVPTSTSDYLLHSLLCPSLLYPSASICINLRCSTSEMATRIAHKKSRYGCTSCKTRRVKCDEVKPTCSRCMVASRACEYQRGILECQPTPNVVLSNRGSTRELSHHIIADSRMRTCFATTGIRGTD